jgi:hypothetical protein
VNQAEMELETELQNIMGKLVKSSVQAEAQTDSNQPPGVLAFQIPEAPYNDTLMQFLHKSVDVIETAHMTTGVFGSLLEGTVGAAAFEGIVTVLSVAAGVVGPFLPAAVGLMEGRANASKKGVRAGFPIGVVAGANGSPWANVRALFGKTQADARHYFDPGAGIEEARGFNSGLVTGWAQGQEIGKTPAKKRFFWSSLYKIMRPEIKTLINNWTRLSSDDRRSFYYEAARAFNEIYVRN